MKPAFNACGQVSESGDRASPRFLTSSLWGINRPSARAEWAKDSRQTEVSRRVTVGEPTLTVGRETEAGLIILGGEIGQVVGYFLAGYPARKAIEDIVDRNAKSADAGLSAAFTGLERDDVPVVHGPKSRRERLAFKRGLAERRPRTPPAPARAGFLAARRRLFSGG
jgi:hypothetical protein